LPTFSALPPLREQNARVYAEPRADGGGFPSPILSRIYLVDGKSTLDAASPAI